MDSCLSISECLQTLQRPGAGASEPAGASNAERATAAGWQQSGQAPQGPRDDANGARHHCQSVCANTDQCVQFEQMQRRTGMLQYQARIYSLCEML